MTTVPDFSRAYAGGSSTHVLQTALAAGTYLTVARVPVAMALFYYSTNPWIKWYICNRWRGDRHHVWCSEIFDPETVGENHHGSLIPQTSSPCAIYRDLAKAVRPPHDRHNAKITSQRASLTVLAERWRAAGEIEETIANEILFLLQSEEFSIWRPQLYIIPQAGIARERVERVPIQERAGMGDEFRIRDLAGGEFERIELRVA